MIRQRYLEDLSPGESFTSPSQQLTAMRFMLFSVLTGDNHPIHHDSEYAKERGFEAPVAHGLLLASMAALGGNPISDELRDSMIALLSEKSRFRKPAMIGDTVEPTFTVLSARIRDEHSGLLRLGVVVRNQRRDVLLEGEQVFLIRRRPR